MNYQYAIFDMDGTLLDSLPYWARLASDYLAEKGIPVSEELDARLAVLSLAEAAVFFKDEFSMPEQPSEIYEDLMDRIRKHYIYDIVLKPGVSAFLKQLSEQGIPMCVATASALELGKPALERNGILPYFSFLLDCGMAGAGKTSPAIYQMAAERFGAHPSECVVIEDAAFALKTAREAGFQTIEIDEVLKTLLTDKK